MEEKSWQEEGLKEDQNYQSHLIQVIKNNMSIHIYNKGVTFNGNTFFLLKVLVQEHFKFKILSIN